jgi:rhomboid family GlyGly-CTERM serine protease
VTGWGPFQGGHNAARRTPCASLFLAAAAVVIFLWPGLSAHLQYDRAAVAAGEVWRLVSGHWAHYSFDHVLWDVVAFSALGVACERRSRARFLVCLGTSALAISVSVWLMLPQIQVYRGLSGIDSALFTFLAASMWIDGHQSERPGLQAIAMTCVSAFLLKVAFELNTGRTLFVEEMDAGAVGVPLAHIVGAGCGLLVGAGSRLVLRSRHTQQWISSTT